MSAETPNRQPSPRLRAYAEAVEPSPAEIDRAWERFEAERDHRAVAVTGSRLDRGGHGRGLAVAAAALLIFIVGGAAAAGLVQRRIAASSPASTDVVQAVHVAEDSTVALTEASGKDVAESAGLESSQSLAPAPTERPAPHADEEPEAEAEAEAEAHAEVSAGPTDEKRSKTGGQRPGHPGAETEEASGAAAKAPAPSEAPESDLAAERRLLSRAQRAATRKKWAEANRWLERHEADYPDGQLVELRLGLGAIVACSQGERARGAGLSRQLAKRQPASPLLARARAACKAAE